MIAVVWGTYTPPVRVAWGELAGSTPQTPNPENLTQPVAVLVATAGAASWSRTEW